MGTRYCTDGAQRTHQLLDIFTSKVGQPNRVYLGGASMGGLIAIKLAETHPDTYDGVLAACAVAGGTQRNFDYNAHVRTLFDFFYPSVLPGNASYRLTTPTSTCRGAIECGRRQVRPSALAG